jgi:hypothetical protein
MDGASASGKFTSDDLWNAMPSAAQALAQDAAAIADPSKASHAEKEVCRLLSQMLGYRPVNATQSARWLLVRCGNDYEGLRKLIIAKGQDFEFMQWVLDQANVYQLRAVLADEYRKEQARLARKTTYRNEWQTASQQSWEMFLEKNPEYKDPEYLDAELRKMGKDV